MGNLMSKKFVTTNPEKIAVAEKRRKRMLASRRNLAERCQDTTALRELAPLAQEINVRLEKAARVQTKALDHRLAAAQRMEEARVLCERKKINFKRWAEEHIKLSYNEVKRLARVGASDDPRAALEDMRAKTRTRTARVRAKKEATPSAPSNEPKDTPYTLEQQTREIERLVVEAGDLEQDIVGLKAALEAARDQLPTLDLEALKEAFEDLDPSDKIELLRHAAEQIGAELRLPDFARGEAELTTIPGFLKRP